MKISAVSVKRPVFAAVISLMLVILGLLSASRLAVREDESPWTTTELADVANEVRSIAGVVAADDVTGPYDVIARASADSMDDLGKMVVSRIQMIEGITRTLTCPVVNL